MKKLLIIIGISVFFLMIAVGAAYNSQIIHVDQLYRNMPSSTCYQPTTDKPHEDAVWNLDECYWFVDDPNIPYELQLVLDYCSDSYHYSDDLLVFTNETHYIDNRDCEWIVSLDWKNIKNNGFFDPGGTFILDSTPLPSEQLQKILDDCNTPSMGLDMSRELTNGTHSINNNSCEWKLVEKDPNPTHLGGPIIVDDFTSDDETLLDKYKDLPEVVAFYAKYDDAQVSVREDHMSYFAGSDDAAFIRMNVFFDDDKTLDHIETKCYFQKVLQFEMAQEDIVNSLEKYDCKK